MVKVLVAHTMKGNVSLKEKKDSSAICCAYSVLLRKLFQLSLVGCFGPEKMSKWLEQQTKANYRTICLILTF